MNKYAQVLVNIAKIGTRTFSYLIPDDFQDVIKVGQPVLVPFGNQGVINAFVVGFSDYLPDGIKAKSIYEILDNEPIFDIEYLHFLNWVSEYYCCDFQTVLASAVPMKFFSQAKRVVRLLNPDFVGKSVLVDILKQKSEIPSSTLQKKSKLTSSKFYEALRKLKLQGVVEVVTIVEEKSSQTQFEKRLVLKNPVTDNKRYAAVLEVLASYDEMPLMSEFLKQAHTTAPTVKKLSDLGHLEIIEQEVYRNPLSVFANNKSDKFPPMSKEQEFAFGKIKEALNEGSSKPILLYGVTGSGKTEVYLRAMKETLDKGQNVLFLAPEIAIASMLTERIAKRFGIDSVAIWHSSISDGERYDVWEKIRRNQIKILAGARSAVFAPLKNIGLIVIDEEHDSSYKQTSPAPRYNAKFLAEQRAKRLGASLIMGSATPDVATFYRAMNSGMILELKERFGDSNLADVHIIDMRDEMANKNHSIFSRSLKNAMEANLANKKQTILLINRRGFSTVVHCPACGYVAECKKCSIPLILHKTTDTLRCHYCNYEQEMIDECPECGFDAMMTSGIGTQRVEEEVKLKFPSARVARLDSDALSRKNLHIEILRKFQNGEIDILVGTQMIAKGLDNPNVTLVGVLSADSSFNLPDYRASERGFQLLTQVAGRAGRGEFDGKVYFQTYSPDFYALQNAQNQDYQNFYKNEMEEREDLAYPPFSQMVRLVLSSKNEYRAEKLAQEIVLRLKTIIDKQGTSEFIEVLGPAACVIARIKDEYRFQILIKNRLEDKGHFFITSFVNKIIMPADIKLIIDIDPSDML
ncbi:MAG: primosomal protein N' [Candidatus Gastranaerophilales bacterium]|nr:primosomal protein N' [Candidatus Gastranaerophilales bacterium]